MANQEISKNYSNTSMEQQLLTTASVIQLLFGVLPFNFDLYSENLFNYLLYPWDTSTSSQVSNCDGVVLEIYLDHKFQWPQEGLNCESLACEVVT